MKQKTISNQYEVSLHKHIIKVFHASDIRLHDNHLGCKKFTNYQRIALLILFSRSRKALRDFVHELFESKWPKWLDLKDIPNFSTISRWLKKWSLTKLRKILEKTVSSSKPKIMAIDATGFDSWGRSRHYERRVKQCGVHDFHMPYAKADLLVDTKSKLIHDFVLRLKPRHDVLGARTIFKRLKHKDVLILGDKGYDSEELHELVSSKNCKFFAPVRNFKVKKTKGPFRRKCVRGNKQYFQRNIVESINFSLKSRFRSLRNRLHHTKKKEFAWKIITYNLEKLSNKAKIFILLFKRFTFCNRAEFDKNIKIYIVKVVQLSICQKIK